MLLYVSCLNVNGLACRNWWILRVAVLFQLTKRIRNVFEVTIKTHFLAETNSNLFLLTMLNGCLHIYAVHISCSMVNGSDLKSVRGKGFDHI